MVILKCQRGEEALPDGVRLKLLKRLPEVFFNGQPVHLLFRHGDHLHQLFGKFFAHGEIAGTVPDLTLLVQDAGMGVNAVGLVDVHRFLGDGAPRRVQGRDLIVQIQKHSIYGSSSRSLRQVLLPVADLRAVHRTAHHGKLRA